MARLERVETQSEAKTESQPPQQRADPNSENQDCRPPERCFLATKADRGEDAEEGHDSNWIGERQPEGRQVISEQAFGIRLGIQLRFRLGQQGGAADIEQITPARDPQPMLIADQPIGDDGQAEPGDDPEDRVGCRGAETRHQTCQLALENCPANAHDADGADRNGYNDADHDAFQKKYKKHVGRTPGQKRRQSPGTAERAQPEMQPLYDGRSRAMLFGTATQCELPG